MVENMFISLLVNEPFLLLFYRIDEVSFLNNKDSLTVEFLDEDPSFWKFTD